MIKQLFYKLLVNFSSSFSVLELEDGSCITIYYFNSYCVVQTEEGILNKITNEKFESLYKFTNIIYP
jgi:hypothetical protein